MWKSRAWTAGKTAVMLAAACAWGAVWQGVAQAVPPWKAGAAKVAITPTELMWMSGYGGRDHVAEGKLQDLWAKALVLEDARGKRAVLITTDLVGIDRDTSLAVREALAKRFGLEAAQVAINTSHTHCGPVVGSNLQPMYALDDAQWKQVADYTARLRQQLVDLVGEAIDKLAPASLQRGNGRATFAVNRRNNDQNNVPALRAEHSLKGPTDHDVPVLAVRRADGSLASVVVGYACHATTLSFYQWCGDYPGFMQQLLEQNHPGTVAMFWAGCGADQNPLPRRTVELAQEYGHRLADAAETVLAGPMKEIPAALWTAYEEVPLPLDTLPTREQLEQQAQSNNRFEAQRARHLLAGIDADRPLSPTYPYPVQVWRLGDLLWVTLGGEVVVDYALRLKHQYGAADTWVAGYTNDVMAYIPSRRVLTEGGYEGGGSMVYYGLPTVWAPTVEETIVKAVARLADSAAEARAR